MPPVTPETVVEQFEWRYATKKFDPARTIPPATWAALEQALVLTPSSYGLQPWKFFVVTDPAVKAQLPAHSWGQRQPQDCSHMVVLAIKANVGETDIDRYVARVSEVRGQSVERWPVQADDGRQPDRPAVRHQRVGGPAGVHRAGPVHGVRRRPGRGHLPDGGDRSGRSTTRCSGSAARGIGRWSAARPATGRPTTSTRECQGALQDRGRDPGDLRANRIRPNRRISRRRSGDTH